MSSEVAGSAKKEQTPNVVNADNGGDGDGDAKEDDVLPKHWTKVRSKKHPDRFYYFNVATKESLWEHPGRSKALEKEKDIIRNVVGKVQAKGKQEKVVQLKNDTQFKVKKNLAKERLDKLQKQLELERKAENEKRAKAKGEAKTPESPRKKAAGKASAKGGEGSSPSKLKRKRVGSDELPSKESKPVEVSSKSKAIAKKTSVSVVTKRLNKDVKQEVAKPPVASELLKLVKDVGTPPKTSSELKSFKIPKKAKQAPVSSSIFMDIQKLNESQPSSLPSPKTDLPQPESVSKEAVLDSTPKTSYAQQFLQAIERRSSPTLLPQTPIQRDPKGAQEIVTVPQPNRLLQSLQRTQICPSPQISPLVTPTITSTPKLQALIRQEQDTPRSVKSPANDRLSGIREQLAQEVAQQTTLLNEDAEMTDLSAAADDHDDQEEAMDWEDIPEEEALREVVAVRQLLPIGFTSVVLDTAIPEYGTHLFDAIHFRRFVFLVMDTNVFLSHLKGVERLLEKGFPHLGQPILVIPYIVLQELDRIKHREKGKPLSQAASQSIRFLNEHLKRRDPRVKGQSTVEAAVHLVPVENPDDHIVNCCFQVRQIIAGRAGTDLMLLSNDVNLRNKALVNGVPAFGYGELMAEADRIRFAADDDGGGATDGGGR
ncbi:transcription elongation regulator 1-like [Aedes albopictus]|uniref:WW domain-containing protein n=1 Tax=Aedes albopictus TaxID=7160 RepID=A0ABM1Z0Q8_AEDAL